MMNTTIRQANAILQRGGMSSDMTQRLMANPATNSRRTVIDPSRVDVGRAIELSGLLHTDGNYAVHSRDPIMKRPHQRLQFPWLVTRGNSDKARIYVWENKCW